MSRRAGERDPWHMIDRPVIDRLTFVYDADGTLVGELRYWFGTLFGASHCSLCDITHSRWRRRP